MSAERLALHPEPDEMLASEAGILGILIWLADFAGPRLARLNAGMFRDARHQIIYEVVQRLHSERKAADIAAVLESLKAANVLEEAGGAEYVKGMVDSAVNGGAYMFERYVGRLRTAVSGSLSVVSCAETAAGERLSLDKVTDQVGDKVTDFDRHSAASKTELESSANPQTGKSALHDRRFSGQVTEQVGDKDTGAGEQPAEGGIGESDLSAGARILQDLRALFLRFVVLPPHAAEMLPLWTLHTYAWELRRVTTYLAIVSPEKRCGKTTLLSLMQTVVKRPQLASNISPPSIFHAIEEMRPALLIDEFDSFLQGKDELRGILNAGYTRDSAYVLRASGQGQKLRRFSCWCPKVIAGIGRLPETLADRCIVMTMRRKTDEEQCERFDEYDGTELRDRCERWVEDNRYEIERRRPCIPKELNDRAADIWEPLLVLADLAGGPWPELARRAAVGLSTLGVEQDMTGMLLNDIRIVFRVLGSEKLFSRTLVEALLMLPERPWKEARRGGQINELWLAQRLAPFGIRSGTVRLGEETAKGYCLADFADTFARYLPKVA